MGDPAVNKPLYLLLNQQLWIRLNSWPSIESWIYDYKANWSTAAFYDGELIHSRIFCIPGLVNSPLEATLSIDKQYRNDDLFTSRLAYQSDPGWPTSRTCRSARPPPCNNCNASERVPAIINQFAKADCHSISYWENPITGFGCCKQDTHPLTLLLAPMGRKRSTTD